MLTSRRLLSGLLWLACVGAAPGLSAVGQTPPPAGGPKVPDHLRYHPDQVFWKNDKIELKADIVVPKTGKRPYPLVAIIHGGGWTQRNFRFYTPLAVKLAERGYVAALITHRLSVQAPFPAQVHDVKEALRWLRGNAAKFEIDKTRFGIYGYSSGGHLACLLGMARADDLRGKGSFDDESAEVQCVVSASGLTDLTELHASCLNGRLGQVSAGAVRFALETFLKGPPDKTGRDYHHASPIQHVHKDAAPILLMHGTADELIPIEQSERLHKKLKHVGADAQFLSLHDAKHDYQPAIAELAEAAAIAFLDRHLREKAK